MLGNTNQPNHPQIPSNQTKLSDQSRTSDKTRLGIDRSKPGSVTKRSERVKKKEKEENLNLKLGGQLKAWLRRDGKKGSNTIEKR